MFKKEDDKKRKQNKVTCSMNYNTQNEDLEESS